MDFRVVIPARYESTRLAKKVLLDIAGKSMLQRVYENAAASGAQSVVIATDDQAVSEAAEAFGAKVCMTDSAHETSVERLAEAVAALGYEEDEIIVSIPADEPLIPPTLLTQLATDLAERDNVKISTACQPFVNAADIFDPRWTKVVVNHRNYVMYFSRAPIPWDEKKFAAPAKTKVTPYHFQHLPVFAYRVGFLHDYIEWGASPLERLEDLESLRLLWHGARIHVVITQDKIILGVDDKADLERVRQHFASQ